MEAQFDCLEGTVPTIAVLLQGKTMVSGAKRRESLCRKLTESLRLFEIVVLKSAMFG